MRIKKVYKGQVLWSGTISKTEAPADGYIFDIRGRSVIYCRIDDLAKFALTNIDEIEVDPWREDDPTERN